MGIPRKRSRKIAVNGDRFLYLVKEVCVPDHKDQKEISVTVQEDCISPGMPMQFKCVYGTAVTPDMIRNIIMSAKEKGWNPSARGGVFNFERAFKTAL